MSASTPNRVLPKPEVLRQNVAAKLSALTPEQLAVVHEWFQQLELEQAARDLQAGLAVDESAGRLTPEAIEASIREFRRKHPYAA